MCTEVLVNQHALQGLLASFKKKRGNNDDSDCTIIEKVWRVYWVSDDKEVRCKAFTWLVERLLDSDTSALARRNVYLHFYHNRHALSKKHREMYRTAVRSLPKRKQKKFRKARNA